MNFIESEPMIIYRAGQAVARWAYATFRWQQALRVDAFLGEIVYTAPEWR